MITVGGLFGNTDAANVPDDPFYVAPGTYGCVLNKAEAGPTNDGSKYGIAIGWVIEEEGEFEGNSISEWLQVFPELEEEDVTPEIRKTMARTKQRLLQLGVDEEEMDSLLDDDNLSNLVGLTADVTVKETLGKVGSQHEGKKFTNVVRVTLT